MKSFAKILVAGAVAASVSLSAMAGSHSKITVGYITKSATNAGWIMINNGAADAAKEVGAKLITVGPAFQGDLSSQLEVFENLTAQGVNAIAVAPVDSAGIAPAVADAMAESSSAPS
ncbi:MAG: sugar ABC transporter substrate-binding protein, partial [Gammaproteobacteria bacterium]|nr:sugar ABC transporter substrate-binding protein [Gammaproteobacteria bacterium]